MRTGEKSWRDFQKGNRLIHGRPRKKKKGPRLVLLLILLAVALAVLLFLPRDEERPPVPEEPAAPQSVNGETSPEMDLAALAALLASESPDRLVRPSATVTQNGRAYEVKTFIDGGLQEYLEGKLDTRHARAIGIAALEPSTGRVKALVGWAGGRPDPTAVTRELFPAASLFKIVTAAAALEDGGLSPSSPLYFNGQAHTLYKSQLKDIRNRYTQKTDLTRAFAKSINPVFGKLGLHQVGCDPLMARAGQFLFGRDILFDLPCEPSVVTDPQTPYAVAEAACGFNRITRITPLHGALLAAASVNQGEIMRPALIATVTDPLGQRVYTHHPQPESRALSPEGAQKLETLMNATVAKGTAHKTFSRLHRDRVLKHLTIGGKTGSINDHDNYDIRYDWFTGFARDKRDGRTLAVSVLVAHEEYIGTRAAQYARWTFRKYFE